MNTTQNRPSPNDLYSVREVMLLFKISRRTINYWIVRGILLPIRFGGKKLQFLRPDIEALIAKK